jgi:hypothetical protein
MNCLTNADRINDDMKKIPVDCVGASYVRAGLIVSVKISSTRITMDGEKVNLSQRISWLSKGTPES